MIVHLDNVTRDHSASPTLLHSGDVVPPVFSLNRLSHANSSSAPSFGTAAQGTKVDVFSSVLVGC